MKAQITKRVLEIYQKLAAILVVLPTLRGFFDSLQTALTNGLESSDLILNSAVTIFVCVIAIFVFRGRKWAIILMIVLLTLNQIILFIDQNYSGILMWLVTMFFLEKVLRSKSKT